MTLTRHVPNPLSYSIWTKVGDGRHSETPTHSVEPKCGISNNALAKVRQWPQIVDVEDGDGHHKLMSKRWCYNNLQNTTVHNNILITGTRSNHKKRRRTTYDLPPHSTCNLHNEKPLGLPKSGFPALIPNLKFHERMWLTYWMKYSFGPLVDYPLHHNWLWTWRWKYN